VATGSSEVCIVENSPPPNKKKKKGKIKRKTRKEKREMVGKKVRLMQIKNTGKKYPRN
jgi:hypothetical protein